MCLEKITWHSAVILKCVLGHEDIKSNNKAVDKIFLESRGCLEKITRLSAVILKCVLGHEDIHCNNKADALAMTDTMANPNEFLLEIDVPHRGKHKVSHNADNDKLYP